MLHITPYLRYLAIPYGYGPTADLHWSHDGDAIETDDGRTFFMKAGLPRFLEGFASKRLLVHFVYILEMLDLLGHRDRRPKSIPTEPANRVCGAFRAEGLPLRNAGVFFAVICRDMPPTHVLESDHLNLAKWLTTRPVLDIAPWQNQEEPPLTADEFHQLLADNLTPYSEEELRHWFHHGHGPIYQTGKRLAEEVVNAKPPAIRGTLDDLIRERPRLAGALPLVGNMIGALSLPPRKRAQPQLPLGGYADVTTRGEPERLLPSQFALDQDEFVRRFAEKELLFFQREEPPQRTRETLVLLVDQGVRTWGVVRLALSAAVLAFRKLAERKKQAWTIRFSSAVKERLDPAAGDHQTMADRLEASDLSAHPAALLAEEADDALTDDADLVLLTHPLALHDPSVRGIGHDLPDGKRLFALAVDEEGAAQFSQVRHGELLPVSRFRVQFQEPEAEPPPAPTYHDERAWVGDVEPIPFPFPIGPLRNLEAVEFDAGTTHLLAATQKGYLHLWRLDDGKLEVLPRAYQNGQVLRQPETVLGLLGGFLVGGVLGTEVVAVHYDLVQRTVRIYKAGAADSARRSWFVLPKQRLILIRRQDGQALVMDSIKLDSKRSPVLDVTSVARELNAMNRLQEPGWTPVYERGQTPATAPIPYVELFRGHITVHHSDFQQTFHLTADGRPVTFANQKWAQYAAGTLAFAVDEARGDGVTWRFLDMNASRFLGQLDGKSATIKLCRLSPDGRLFAAVSGHGKIHVRVVGEAMQSRLTTAPASVHTDLLVNVYADYMRIAIGNRWHYLSWKAGPLVHRVADKWHMNKTEDEEFPGGRFAATYDQSRFRYSIRGKFDVHIDIAGQIIVYDPRRKEVACIFLPRRQQLAGWMPDGTRFGPADWIGGPAAPDAFERFGEALRRAASEGGT